MRDHAAVGLDVLDALLDVGDEGLVDAGLKLVDGAFGGENLALVFLELFGDVAFGGDEGLLAYPLRGHLVAVGVAHFDVVAEDVVVADAQGTYAGAFGLAGLHFLEVALAAGGDVAEFVQFPVHAARYDIALAYLGGRVLRHRAFYAGEEGVGVPQAFGEFVEGGDAGVGYDAADGGHLAQGAGQLHHLAGVDLAGGSPGGDAVEVAYVADTDAQVLQGLFVVGEELHAVVAAVQGGDVHYREREPLAQQAGAHGGGAAVEHVHERDAFPAGVALEDFQVAEGETVHPHETAFVNAAEAADVAEAFVVGLLKVEDERAGAAYGQGVAIHGEALEGGGAHLAAEFLGGCVLHESPFVEGADVEIGVALLDAAVDFALDDELLGTEGVEEGADVVDAALGHLEGAGGGVQECGAAFGPGEAEAGEPVVLLAFEHRFAEGYAGGEDFRDPPLHKLGLGELGVFELVADGYLIAGADELGKVGVYGVVREPGHLGIALFAVGAAREHDSQDFADGHGIIGIALVEVAHPIEQHGLRMLGLYGEVLFEQRGVFRCFRHCSEFLLVDLVNSSLRIQI